MPGVLGSPGFIGVGSAFAGLVLAEKVGFGVSAGVDYFTSFV